MSSYHIIYDRALLAKINDVIFGCNKYTHSEGFSYFTLTLFRMRVGKETSTSFTPLFYPKVRINLQNFLTFYFNSFSLLLWNFKVISSTSPNLLKLNQDQHSKKSFFWSNPYNFEAAITSLTDTLDLPTWSHQQYNLSRMVTFFFEDVIFIAKCLFKRRSSVAEIIKIAISSIKTTFAQ